MTQRGPGLSAALVHEARLLVEAGGHEALNLRALAARLGVTQPAMYRHFESRDALLDAVAAQASSDLDAEMAEAQVEGDAYAVIRAMGRVWLRFAVTHRESYRLSFGGGRMGRVAALLRDHPRPGWRRLLCALASIAPATDPRFGDSYRALWATLHGLAGLVIERVFHLVESDEARLAAALAALDATVDQLRARWGPARSDGDADEAIAAIQASARAFEP